MFFSHTHFSLQLSPVIRNPTHDHITFNNRVAVEWQFQIMNQILAFMKRELLELNLECYPLYNPPLLRNILFIIHDVALPQMIRSISFLAEAHPFQKCSKAGINRELRASIQGSSSRNMILRLFLRLLYKMFQ